MTVRAVMPPAIYKHLPSLLITYLSFNTPTMHHTSDGLQMRSLDNLHLVYQRAGLVVNTKKTEVLFRFTYLGSILTDDCDLTEEILKRIKLASSAFGRRSRRYSQPKPQCTMLSASEYGLNISAKVGHHIVTISKPWSLSTCQVCTTFLNFAGGTVTHSEIRRRTNSKPMTTSLDWTRNPHAIQPSSSPHTAL